MAQYRGLFGGLQPDVSVLLQPGEWKPLNGMRAYQSGVSALGTGTMAMRHALRWNTASAVIAPAGTKKPSG